MPESPKLHPETAPSSTRQERTTEDKSEHPQYQEGDIIDNIIFDKVDKKGDKEYYKSSDSKRKIIILSESSPKPESSQSYQVKVLKNTKPENPLEGKYVVKIVPSLKEKLQKEQKLITLAQEIQKAFTDDDLELTVSKLRELKKLTQGSSESTEEVITSIEQAIEILGEENVFGPQEVEKTFGVHLKEPPPIPFSIEELQRAEKLGQMLVLRVDKTADGQPMSLEAMNDILVKKWRKDGKGELLATVDGWEMWIGKDFFTKEHPRSGWALVGREVLGYTDGRPSEKKEEISTGKNYIEQTEVIIRALKDQAFKDLELPPEYAEAIAEFESKKEQLAKLIDSNQPEAAKQLAELKISQLTRQTTPEVIYDVAMYYDRHNKRLLGDKYTWTTSRRPNGDFVAPGRFGMAGVYGNDWTPTNRYDHVGVSLSRRL